MKKDEKIFENVQRRVTKLVPELRSLDYSTRLDRLWLITLKARRERGDLIQHFKIIGKLNKVNFVLPNQVVQSIQTKGPAQGIRGNQHRLDRQKVKGYVQRDKCFSNRIVPLWNSLPAHLVNSITTNQFRNRYDNYLKAKKRVYTEKCALASHKNQSALAIHK